MDFLSGIPPLIVALASLTLAIIAGVIVVYRIFPVHLIYKSKIGFAEMLDAIGDPLAVISSDYKLTRANKAYMNLIRKNFSESIGKNCYTLLRNRTSPCDDCHLQDSIKTGTTQFLSHTKHPFGNGSLSFTFTPFAEQDSKNALVIEHIRDITPLEQLKNDLEDKNKSLAKAMRHLKAAQANIRDELRLARQIQQSILPEKAPELNTLAIDFIYHPIADVGGDIYDFITFTDKKFGIFIGDASGHGLSASLIGSISKMSLYNHSKEEKGPSLLLDHLNRDLISNIHTSHYLTCFWCIFDLEKNEINYSRAGHPLPVIIKKDGTVIPLQAQGTIIGMLENATYEEQTMQLEKNDRIYFFTDGIYEIVRKSKRNGDQLGYEQFVQILKECNKAPFSKVIHHVESALSKYIYEDDYTLIVAEVK